LAPLRRRNQRLAGQTGAALRGDAHVRQRGAAVAGGETEACADDRGDTRLPGAVSVSIINLEGRDDGVFG
jgi:hypothetical protein